MPHRDAAPLPGTCLVAGTASGELLFSDTALSFWGGVDPASGEIIDRHHPLSGQNLSGKILAIPGGRGSCTGSSVMLETILSETGPAALVFARVEDILTLGVIIAHEIFGKSIPVICLSPAAFATLRHIRSATVNGDRVHTGPAPANIPAQPPIAPPTNIQLTPADQAFLDGAHGRAAQACMRIILRMAAILGADTLIDVTQAHIDGCIYTGPSSLAFARRLRDWGARVVIPTTMNAISVDQRRWREHGVNPAFGEPASALADAYVAMGAKPSFTCAPYLLDTVPRPGEQIAWAESNAVVYANSVLAARTMKYPDYLDIAIALTGRAPNAGCHLDSNRHARVLVTLPALAAANDAFYPLLGYHVGLLSPDDIPVIAGLAHLHPGPDDLKAFGAAFATTSSAPMFHMLGITPQAGTLADATGPEPVLRAEQVTIESLNQSFRELNGAPSETIDVVALGNPHFSEAECQALALLCKGRHRHARVAVIVTCSRITHDRIRRNDAIGHLDAFGVQFVTDTCWCMITEPVLPPGAGTIMTNSGKYAHYGPGLVGRPFRFASLASCVKAACTGIAPTQTAADQIVLASYRPPL